MKHVWAPWRMEYILGEKSDGCFLCDIIASDEDLIHHVIKRGQHCIIVMNRYPYNNGHLMVAPYRHVASLEDMTPEERAEMMNLTTDSIAMIKQTMNAEGFNVGLNLGSVAGAGLKDHIHQHIVPRWNGDTNFMPVVGDTKVIPQALDEVCAMFREAI